LRESGFDQSEIDAMLSNAAAVSDAGLEVAA